MLHFGESARQLNSKRRKELLLPVKVADEVRNCFATIDTVS